MIKKIILIIFMLFCGAAQSAQVVNVEYIHNAIAQKWDITVPYNPELTNPRVAANMKYLLTAIDVANEMLNGEKTTDYGTGEYATMAVADTIAADTAVGEFILRQEAESAFYMRPQPGEGNSFQFSISAQGAFYIDWGDGTTEQIDKTDVSTLIIAHQYDNDAGNYIITLTGLATAYDDVSNANSLGVIDFNTHLHKNALSEISGCLACVFPTLSDGTQPSFIRTFAFTKITKIPEKLLDGITGVFTDYMFFDMFRMCTNLTGASAKINGKYIYEILPDGMYQVAGMYNGCTGLNDYAAMPFIYKVDTSG